MQPQLIKGGIHSDQRGTIRFVNGFDMSSIKRFYCITHPDTKVIRGWQGHKVEQKWFHCIRGRFIINLIKVKNFESNILNESLSERFILNTDEPMVLYVPGGYVTGFKALDEESTLLVYSDMGLVGSISDDFRFDIVNENLFSLSKNQV